MRKKESGTGMVTLTHPAPARAPGYFCKYLFSHRKWCQNLGWHSSCNLFCKRVLQRVRHRELKIYQETDMNKSFIAMLLAFLMSASFIAGCATIEGAGEDIETAGEIVQDAADPDGR